MAERVSVMIVDDQSPFRDAARAVVSRVDGFELVAEVESGEDAVATSEQLHPDLVLMDLQLPGIDGAEALRLIRAEVSTRSMPVVAVTAFVMADDRSSAFASGFDGYVEKPISVRGLAQQVQDFLTLGGVP